MKKEKQRKPVVLYFHVHQPVRLNRVGFLDIGEGFDYYNTTLNKEIVQRAADKCYLPVNDMLRRLLEENDEARLSFSISGPALQQFETTTPAVLDSFKSLVGTGKVELIGETSHHTLACLMPNDEFTEQVREHVNIMRKHFGTEPAVFRNTELIYSNSVGSRIAQMGFKGIITDGVERVIRSSASRGIFRHPYHDNFSILLRHNELSDDVAFRFHGERGAANIDSYIERLENEPGLVMISVDYETFGEHQPQSGGIITFLHDLIQRLSVSKTLQLMTPSQVIASYPHKDSLSVPEFISWADSEKDLSAWLGNELQNEAFLALQSLEDAVRRSGNSQHLETWRNLQTSDHLYYMSTKTAGDGEVHNYFSHYNSPYEAYINYMNVLNDFRLKLRQTDSPNTMETAELERRHDHGPVWADKAQANYLEATSH